MDPYAIELNLRKGGTTHPFLTLQFLTDGTYDAVTAPSPLRAAARSTSSRPTTSSRDLLRGLTVDDLFDVVVHTACTSTTPARPGSSST